MTMQIDTEPKSSTLFDLHSSGAQEHVLRQLSRIVAHESFRHSKRSARLLDYLVRETLAGHAEWLKERRIGVELFNRPADYDTNADPVVRATASEIRRRLAQYYQEAGESEHIHIRLQPGSYSPVFTRGPEVVATPEATMPSAAVPSPDEPAPPEPSSALVSLPLDHSDNHTWRRSLLRRSISVIWVAAAAAMLLVVAAAWHGAGLWRKTHDPVHRFWLPVVDSGSTATIVVGAVDIKDGSAVSAPFNQEVSDQVNGLKQPPAQTGLEIRPIVMWQESEISARVAELLTEQHTHFQLRASNVTTLDDLRRGPIILLGIIDNPWAVRLLPHLRFRVRMDPSTQLMWIEDGDHLEQRQMKVLWGVPYSNSYNEYALITRCHDPLTGQPVILIGGLGLHGTQAAGEFVSSHDNLARLSPGLRDSNLNVQIVLRIAVVNGAVAPPQVEAIHYWN